MEAAFSVVICDDDDERAGDWSVRVSEQLPEADVAPLGSVAFAEAVRDLKARMVASEAQTPVDDNDQAGVVDRTDILVLDSDLTPYRDMANSQAIDPLVATHLASQLGVEVAHLARAYSQVGAIVVVNQAAKRSTFDLTLTKTNTYVADAYITDDEFDNPGLWDPAKTTGYRPWSWPDICNLPARIAEAVDTWALSDFVCAALGLEHLQEDWLLNQIESLDMVEGQELAKMTFEDVALSPGFGLGLRPKEVAPDATRLRIAVCGVRRWLERVVVPAQNVLIDLPHLQQRNPWLLNGDRQDIDAWNRVVGRWAPDEPPVIPEAFNRSASQLLGRNVWNVRQVPPRPMGERVQPSDPVFCEDTSSFLPMDSARGFLSNVEGSQARRYVSKVNGVTYAPPTRLMR